MAQIGKSRPDSGLGLQAQVLGTLQGAPSPLGSGPGEKKGRDLAEDDVLAVEPGDGDSPRALGIGLL